MKRIVFLSGEIDLKGGGELSLIGVIKGLRKDYKILCVCKCKGALSDALITYGVEILFCDLKWSRKFKYFFSNCTRLLYLYLKVRKFTPHLIYANSGWTNPFAARLAEKLSSPLITHVRDLFDDVSKDKYLFRHSDRIIACSEAVANLIKKHNDNVKVVYNAIDPQKFFPSLRSSKDNLRNKLKLTDYFLVGNVGTITYKKGYFEFVEVAKEVSKIIPKARFLMVGETMSGKAHILEELKKNIKEDNLEDKFIFTGFVKEAERIIASLDVLLFPPRYEAFARVIIEAFACKVPVISTYSGGAEEAIENKKNGFLFKVGDIKGMTQAVIDLYRNKDLYKFIVENAHTKFLERFTIDRTVREIKSVIDETIG